MKTDLLTIQFEMISLFNKAVNLTEVNDNNPVNAKALKQLIDHGIVVDLKILKQLSDEDQIEFAKKVSHKYGISNDELRSSLFKKFQTIEDSSELELRVAQLLHYMTAPALLDDPFLPNGEHDHDGFLFEPELIKNDDEETSLKDLKVEFNNTFKHIQIIDEDEAEDLIIDFAEGSQPLSEDDTKSIFDLIINLLSTDEIETLEINNKELMCLMYDRINQNLNYFIVPKNVDDFMRLIVYKITNSTLLIKSKNVIQQIKNTMNVAYETSYMSDKTVVIIEKYLDAYVNKYGEVRLAQSFNRYKSIFLALKNDYTKSLINKISRLSKKHHKPLQKNIMSNAVDMIEKQEISTDDLFNYLDENLNDISTYQLVKLYNAFSLRGEEFSSLMYKDNQRKDVNFNEDHSSIHAKGLINRVYKIRNGETYIKEYDIDQDYSLMDVLTQTQNLISIKDYIKGLLIERLENEFHNKVVRLDDFYNQVQIKMPTSTKNFIGHMPEFTNVTLKGHTTLGVTWRKKCDIDLSCTDIEHGDLVSWHSTQVQRDSHSSHNVLMHSGDMRTINNKGFANETVFISDDNKSPLLFDVALYSMGFGADLDDDDHYVDYQLSFGENVSPKLYANMKNVKLNLPLFIERASSYGRFIANSFYNESDQSRTFVVNSTSTGQRVVNGINLNFVAANAIQNKTIAYMNLNDILNESNILVARNENEYNDFIKWNSQLETVDLRFEYISKNEILKFI